MARIIVMVLGLVGTVERFNEVQSRIESGTAQPIRRLRRPCRYFESVQGTDFDTLLHQLRRPAPPASVRAWVIKNLPAEGELTPTAQEAAKLEVLLPVLAFHGREHDMELRLITAGGLAFARTPRDEQCS